MTDTISFVKEPIRDELSFRQLQTLEDHYKEYHEWLRNKGKDPDQNIGYAGDSVSERFHRTTQFHQWVWSCIGEFTTRFTHTHADEFEQALDNDEIRKRNGQPYAEGSKRKQQQAVENYYLFRTHEYGGKPWKPNITFSQEEYEQADYFTLEERRRLYEATLTYNDLGRYNDLSPKERDRRKQYLAQRLEKPKSEITPTDFKNCRESWKIPSLVSVALDLGARPVFIRRCRYDWYRPEKGTFKIPKEGSPKNNSYWEPGLSSRSIKTLDRWVPQRETISDYDESPKLWLNRETGEYRSDSLNYLLGNLIDEAEIDQTNRQLTWTSIRRSTATYLTYFHSLEFAREQLRHKSLQSTSRYVEIPVEVRQDALDQLGGGAIAMTANQRASQKMTNPSLPEGMYES